MKIRSVVLCKVGNKQTNKPQRDRQTNVGCYIISSPEVTTVTYG